MKTEKQILLKVDSYIKKSLAVELKQQGHYLTGSLEHSIQGNLQDISNGASLEGTVADYGYILDAGTKPNKIPYQERSGAKTSKYISALIEYFKLRKGLNEKEARGAAFTTAKVHKREGMPTRNSYSYAQNNERKQFINRTNKAIEKKVDDRIITKVDQLFNTAFEKQHSEII